MCLFFHVNIGKYLLFLWKQYIVSNPLNLIKLYFLKLYSSRTKIIKYQQFYMTQRNTLLKKTNFNG